MTDFAPSRIRLAVGLAACAVLCVALFGATPGLAKKKKGAPKESLPKTIHFKELAAPLGPPFAKFAGANADGITLVAILTIKNKTTERWRSSVLQEHVISSWAPIATVKSGKLKDAEYPSWMPDEYAAWSWRAYHSSCTDIQITGPKVSYSKHDGKWGGTICGLGYGGFLSSTDKHDFRAAVKGDYIKIEFYDGHHKLGEATKAPWDLKDISLEQGLHVLFAVGVKADGTRAACRPALVIFK